MDEPFTRFLYFYIDGNLVLLSFYYLNQVKSPRPVTQFTHWRKNQLFNIAFASYTLSHHSFPRHFHDHYVIELVIKGSDSFYCDGGHYTAQTSQLALINPGEVHTGSTPADQALHYFSLYPDKKALQQVANALHISIPADFIFERPLIDQPPLSEKFLALYQAFVSGDQWQQEEIFLDCMYGLLSAENKEPIIKLKKTDPRILLLIDHITTHSSDDISLEQMAGIVNLNPFYLVRLFKQTIGLSPYDYLLITRTEHAKRLLRTGYKVQDAAASAGFYDTSHFNRSLRKITGTSPKSFLSSKSQFRTSFNA
jgi:AraC-like DNA-binding protein